MAGVDGEGGERWKDVLGEMRPRSRPLLRIEGVRRDQMQTIPLQAGEDVARPDAVLLLGHGVDDRADRRDLLVGQEAVRSRLADAAQLLLLEAGHADHEELVEVRRDDGEELEPLENGQRGIGRLFEHARVELQPR